MCEKADRDCKNTTNLPIDMQSYFIITCAQENEYYRQSFAAQTAWINFLLTDRNFALIRGVICLVTENQVGTQRNQSYHRGISDNKYEYVVTSFTESLLLDR